MNFTRRSAMRLGVAGATVGSLAGETGARAGQPIPLAPRPPMGWNSWNSTDPTNFFAAPRLRSQLVALT